MPQLDYIILFPQIFWLFIIFTLFYTVLTHFYLPKFLKSLKSRKNIIDLNELKIIEIKQRFTKLEQDFEEILIVDLARIKGIFNTNPTFEILNLKNSETQKADEVISNAIRNSVLFYNFQILDSVEIYYRLANNPKITN
uniref:ATP synthase F0 subunit 8 n=1 Tax=Pterocladiella luxurians TaxID=2909240 RepID=A0A1D8X7D2_9FLOR|nr:ATP synthase F0 subunit 8 [Gelidium crinale f. luxurians]